MRAVHLSTVAQMLRSLLSLVKQPVAARRIRRITGGFIFHCDFRPLLNIMPKQRKTAARESASAKRAPAKPAGAKRAPAKPVARKRASTKRPSGAMRQSPATANCCPDSWPSAGLQETIECSRAFFAGKRAVVTGAFGFVGGHLARALHAAGVQVTALDCDTAPSRGSQLNLTGLREQMDVVQADITDRQAMRDVVANGRFDFVFHLAAGATTVEKAISDPYSTILSNTMGFVNLAEGARLLPAEERPVIIYSSTDKVYGETEELPYVEEKSNLGGVGVYDAAKLAADIFAGTYHKALGVPTIVLRMCNLFGPFDYNFDYRLVPKAMRNIFRDREAPELYMNALEHFRDYLYVEDAVRAFMHLARHEDCRGRVYNLPGEHYAATPDVLREVVELVAAMQDKARFEAPDSPLATMKWNRSIRIVKSDPRLIVISKQHLDGSRIGREAGFEPQVMFQDGLERTVRFYHWYFTQIAPERPARDDVHHSDEPLPHLSPVVDELPVQVVTPHTLEDLPAEDLAGAHAASGTEPARNGVAASDDLDSGSAGSNDDDNEFSLARLSHMMDK